MELVSSFVCHTLPAPGQVSLKGYSFHSPRQMESQTVGSPSAGRQRVCVKDIHFATFNKRGTGGQLMYVISSDPRPKSPSDSLNTLSWSEGICRPHHVVKICSLLRITYNLFSIAFRAVEGITLCFPLQNGEHCFMSFSVDVRKKPEFSI